jgi:hypothetical protein
MLEILKYATSGFWVFMGVSSILLLVALIIEELLQGFIIVTNRFVRHLNIRSKGWPPEHCNSDGDIIKKND